MLKNDDLSTTPQMHVKIKRMPIGQSMLLFAIPSIVLLLSVSTLPSYLVSCGFSAFNSYKVASALVFTLLLVASLIAYHMEDNLSTWAAFRERFRLCGPSHRDWLWAAGVFILITVLVGFLDPLVDRLIVRGIISLPDWVPPASDPRIELSNQAMESYFGGQVKGNWSALVVSLIVLVLNVFGEELWWRGFILPRQELTHGRHTWIVHGILWAVFHIANYWRCITLLPYCLAIAFISQRLKSTWPAIAWHFISNGFETITILLLVLGVI